ncbi:holo-ACP synthase [Neptuniibacter sp. CAU 1671]|nr:holo-ACP synthase [Neptuniibacter sp. CAU 1671]MDF2183042.1 holo-ACP synthase [Neptuniibacter sp. CAU 1671]
MILGVGTDILAIERIGLAITRTPKLPARILTTTELAGFELTADPARYLAKRFAAKEAVVKALGSGIGHGVSWRHIQIEKDGLGRPLVQLEAGAKVWADQKGIGQIHLSYSDEKDYILAFAVAESRSEEHQ